MPFKVYDLKIALFIGAGFSFLAVADMSIGYYTFLRIYLFVVAGILAVDYFSQNEVLSARVLLFGIIALLFNPFIPVYLQEKELWTIINIIVGVIFVIAGIKFKSEVKDG